MTTDGSPELARTAAERSEWLFRALYSLPPQRVFEVVTSAIRRYLPIFRAKHPEVTWPGELLDNLAGWYEAHEMGFPADPDCDSADTSFRHALHALVVAWRHREDPARRTAAAVVAIRTVRAAFQTNVWAADDPEAFTAWATGDLANMRRTLHDNVAAVAVGEREWRETTAGLEAPASTNAEIEAAIERWRQQDHDLL